MVCYGLDMNTAAPTTIPTTARQVLDQFEATVSPRARTHIHFRTDDEGHTLIVAQRSTHTVNLGWLSGTPGTWVAVDPLNLHHGWTFPRKTRTEAVDAMLAGEGYAVSPRIVRRGDDVVLYIAGYVQVQAWYSSDQRRWLVKVCGESTIHSEHTSRAAAIDVLAVIAHDRFGVIAEVI
jgi:hypothetical protein